MAEIIRTGKEPTPALRFVGKKYGDEDRVDGFFGAKWGEWFDNGWFEQLEALNTSAGSSHYIGLMGHENGVFKYWVGMFLPPGTQPPEGFSYMDYAAGHLGFARLKGKEDSIYGNEPMCCDRLIKEGHNTLDHDFICFERELLCDDPDMANVEEGEKLVDICFFLK